MMLILMVLSLMSTITLVMVSHPLSLGMMLLIQTLIITLTTGFFSHNYWYSYIMFLIMIGGMLVLFIYMTSVASNEKFEYSINLTWILFIIITLSLLMLIITDPYFMYINNMENETLNTNTQFSMALNKFLNFPMSTTFYMIIMYLLITLIAVVKITNIKSGPLRQTN